MVATVVWDGHGLVDSADSLTGWTALKISGTGGGPTAALADGPLLGGAVTCVVSRQRVAVYFDIGSGNELDFSGGGSEENQFIYTWGNFLAAGLLNAQSAGGFGVFLSSLAPTASQYSLFYNEGSDTYDGGWRRFITDPTTTISASAGTALDVASVRYFGVWADVGATTAKFDNLICDRIDVGTGLRVYGTSTVDGLIDDLIANEATTRYGIVSEKLGVAGSAVAVELAGQLKLGDDVGTNAATHTDTDAKIFAADPTYYDGTSVILTVPTTTFGVKCVGNATGATSITIGKKIGTGATAGGRNGWSFVGNSNYDVDIDWDDGNVNTNKWYGCSFEALTGTLSWGTTATHECIGNTFSGCNTFQPVGAIIVRGCNFVALADTTGTNQASLLWTTTLATADITNCNFAANSLASGNVGHDIEIVTAGSVDFSALLTSGAEQEVLFTAASGVLTVNDIDGANFSATPADHTVTGSGSIVVVNAAPIVITVTDEAGTAIQNARVEISATETVGTVTSGDVLLTGLTDVSGIIQDTGYSYESAFDPTGLSVSVKARQGSVSPFKVPQTVTGIIFNAGLSLTIALLADE